MDPNSAQHQAGPFAVGAEARRKPPEGRLPGLAAKVEFLRSPRAHRLAAGGPTPVQAIETHMSWVFLAGERVLKLKKPVRFPVLDFSTLAAREAHCRAELRLNARLAPGVYRGLVALLWQGGAFTLRPEAQLADRAAVVDWLVCMTRLPEARLLDHAIADASVQPADIDALVAVLAAFYRGAAPVAAGAVDLLARAQREQAINHEVLMRPHFAVDGAPQALARLDQALLDRRALLDQRAADGRIVDGHGDLRPEHVCLLPVPVVIDCIEFSARLRQVDPFDELAFLAMECTLAGAPWIAPRLIDGCAAALGDAPPPALLQLYTACRAMLRARLAMAHLLDPQPRTPQRWPPRARHYVAVALTALAALDALDGLDAGPRDDRGARSNA